MKNAKHFSKKGLAILLALMMCLSMLNLTAFAAEAEPGDSVLGDANTNAAGGDSTGSNETDGDAPGSDVPDGDTPDGDAPDGDALDSDAPGSDESDSLVVPLGNFNVDFNGGGSGNNTESKLTIERMTVAPETAKTGETVEFTVVVTNQNVDANGRNANCSIDMPDGLVLDGEIAWSHSGYNTAEDRYENGNGTHSSLSFTQYFYPGATVTLTWSAIVKQVFSGPLESTITVSMGGKTATGSATVDVEGSVSFVPVARVESTQDVYETLGKAIEAVQAADTVTLLKDTREDVTIGDGKTVTLDLNNHTLTGTGGGSVIKVALTGNLTLKDSGTDGRITGGDATQGGGVYVTGSNSTTVNGGTFRMEGGTITGNNSTETLSKSGGGGGVFVGYKGTFIMTGGKISKNTARVGGGVSVYQNATFTMSGGEISENGPPSGNSCTGSGVLSYSGSTFTMSGTAKIINNGSQTNPGYGGGVYAYEAFVMEGGEISGNHGSYGGGVYCTNSSTKYTFTMNGGTITGNSAEVGGGVYIAFASSASHRFVMNNGALYRNTATKAGDDVYNAGGYLTLMDISRAGWTISCGSGEHPITGWYIDSSGSRWGCDQNTDVYTPRTNDTNKLGLKAAHGDPNAELEYTVTYHNNDGTGTSESVPVKTSNGAPVADTFYKEAITREGHTFTGWNTREDGKGTTYNAGAKIERLTGDLNLYAKWEAKRFTVIFDHNNGGLSSGKGSVGYGELIEVWFPPSPPPGRDYTYKFMGFYRDQELTQKWDFDNDRVFSDITLYAKWAKTYTVTFVPNNFGNDIYVEAEPDQLITAPEVTLEGYELEGWYREAEYETAWNFATDTVTEDTTLYAKWTHTAHTDSDTDHLCDVCYCAMGEHKYEPADANTHKCDYCGESKAHVDKAGNDHKCDVCGYVMSGHDYEPDGANGHKCGICGKTGAHDYGENGLCECGVAETYTVTFDLNYAGSAAAETTTVERGKTVAEPAATREGYTFLGWYTAATGGDRYDFSKSVTESFTLYAQWEDVNTGGSTGGNTGDGSAGDTPGGGSAGDTTGGGSAGGNNGGGSAGGNNGGGSAGGNNDIVDIIDEDVPLAGLPFAFEDVAEDDWFYDAVKYVFDAGMMEGTSTETFEPYFNTTRAMLVTILYRMEEEPDIEPSLFEDVSTDTWYSGSVAWAEANGIVKGYSDTEFGPEDRLTREQIAAILYRYAKFKGYDVSASGDLSAFTDGGSVSEWFVGEVKWGVGAEMLMGRDDGTLDPTGYATRAEIATILMRFCEKFASES